MKTIKMFINHLLNGLLFISLATIVLPAGAQEDNNEKEEVQTIAIHSRPLQRVGNTFESIWLIDNQTVLVPLRKTFEFDIQHRFGTMGNGYEDFFGLYAPSNIRLGFGYTPINNLMIGLGFTKARLLWDFNVKYALLKERGEKSFPVSVTYFGNFSVDTRKQEDFPGYNNPSDRYSFFNQIMVAKKLTRDFSVQGSVNLSHMNLVEAYVTEEGEQEGKMKNDHVSLSLLGRYKISDAFALIANYDQPVTQHTADNPYPNISAGVELATPLHAFQVFVGNFQWIVPQYNNFYNSNDYQQGFDGFLIGFNITRLLDTQEEDLGKMMFKRKQEQ